MNNSKILGFMDKIAGKYESAARAVAKLKTRNHLYRGFGTIANGSIGGLLGGPVGAVSGASYGYLSARLEQAASKLLTKSRKPEDLIKARNLAGRVHAPALKGLAYGALGGALTGNPAIAAPAGVLDLLLGSSLNLAGRNISDRLSSKIYYRSIRKAMAKDLASSQAIKAAKARLDLEEAERYYRAR